MELPMIETGQPPAVLSATVQLSVAPVLPLCCARGRLVHAANPSLTSVTALEGYFDNLPALL